MDNNYVGSVPLIEIELPGGARGLKGDQGPKGDKGDNYNPIIEEVETLEPTQPATAEVRADDNNIYFSFGIPKGDPGEGTKLSDFDNDVGFVTADTTELENYALISNTYTKTEIDNSLSSKANTSDVNTALATKVNISDVIDNLTSTETAKPLSAKQGKTLKDTLDEQEEKVNKKPYVFNNVASMKADNTLADGMTVQTIGYYTENDGGASTYKITDEESETEYQEELENGLYATLINYSDSINPCQLGAKHNGVDDDSSILQFCLDALHDGKYNTLDLKGYTYYIEHPLNLKSTYKCSIKNGEIEALSTFVLSNNVDENYLLYLSNTVTDNQSGTFGVPTEDLSIDSVKFDSSLIDGLGCLYLTRYLRININNCYFRRYKTDGIKIYSDSSHELVLTDSVFNAHLYNETNTTGIGINMVDAKDNIFSNIIITDGKYGIKMDHCVANNFSKIHTYGVSDYGIYISTGSQNLFEQIYFDGKGLYMYKPWLTTFINSYFLVNSTPITLDKDSGVNTTIFGLKFIGCVGNNYESPSTTFDLITYPHGLFNGVTFSEFDINLSGNFYNNKYSAIGYDESQNNKVFINSQTQTLLLNGSGVITNATSMSARYTGTIVNNIVDISSYDATGYTWAGLVIPLAKNTNYKTINLYNHKQDFKIYGFSSLAQSSTGTEIKSQNINSSMYTIFNSGSYDYYVLAFYDKKIIEPDVRTL